MHFSAVFFHPGLRGALRIAGKRAYIRHGMGRPLRRAREREQGKGEAWAEMHEQVFQILSWIGVLFLMAAHGVLSVGGSKTLASRISAAGAGISACAAACLAVWAVMTFNLIWGWIAIRGIHIGERGAPRSDLEVGLLGLSLLPLLAWIFGPQAVTWLSSGVFILAWLGFSLGLVRRRVYLGATVLAALPLIPALLVLDAPAFALNEGVGVLLGVIGISVDIARSGRRTNFQRPAAAPDLEPGTSAQEV